MGRFLNPGNGGFRMIVKTETYVDKTGIIAYLNEWIDTDSRFVCVSRARRFGKTVAAQTIQAYYDNSCDSHDLFAPYEIARDPYSPTPKSWNAAKKLPSSLSNEPKPLHCSKQVPHHRHNISTP